MSDPPPQTPYCKNCGSPLSGAYCADCSQRADVHVPSTMELVHEALEGVTHSDSRLWKTISYLLFVPGKLTLEFIAGRRVAYLPPFRLYLVMSILFFLLASTGQREATDLVVAGAGDQPIGAADATPRSTPNCRIHSDLFESQFKRACEHIVRDNGESFVHEIISTAPKAMFIFLPVIAFFHMLLYWVPRARYAVHLLFFVHVHAFAFFIMSLLWLLNDIGVLVSSLTTICNVLLAALITYIPVYLAIAMKRVFKRSWTNTLFKAAFLLFIYVLVLTFTMTGVVLYVALRI